MTSRQSVRGFTLVEAMVALAVLSIGMAGVGTMLHDSMRYNINSVSDRNADAVAQEIMDDLKGQFAQYSFSEIANLTLTNPKFNPPQYEQAGPTSVDKRGMSDRFVYRWLAEQISHNPKAGTMTRVSVLVAYDTAPTVAAFPRDPLDPNFWRFKSRITNFVMSK